MNLATLGSFDGGTISCGQIKENTRTKVSSACNGARGPKNDVSLFFLLSGKGEILMKSKKNELLPISSGQYIAFFPQDVDFQYVSYSKSDVIKIDVCAEIFFKLTGINKNKGDFFYNLLFKYNFFIKHTNINPYLHYLNQIKTEFKTSTFLSLAFLLIKNEMEKERMLFSENDIKNVEGIEKYINKNIDSPPSFNELCKMSKIPPDKFCHIFKIRFGLTPFSYLRELRMKRAMQLIIDTNKNVTDISYELGYNNISYFSKIFLKRFGILPSAVKKQKKTICHNHAGKHAV